MTSRRKILAITMPILAVALWAARESTTTPSDARILWIILISLLLIFSVILAARSYIAAEATRTDEAKAFQESQKDLTIQSHSNWTTLKNLEARLGRIEGQVSQIASIEAHLQSLEKRVSEVCDTVPTLWKMGLRQPGPVQRKTLQLVLKVVRGIANGSDLGFDMTNSALRGLIGSDLGEVSLDDAENRRLVFEVRDHFYRLDATKFDMRFAIQSSIKAMVADSNRSDAIYQRVRGYFEIMRHADEWDFEFLKELSPKLRDLRNDPEFSSHVAAIPLQEMQRTVGSSNPGIRLWKRVWPCQTYLKQSEWGRIRCLYGEDDACGDCSCVLNEISLCGASCLTCKNRNLDKTLQIELYLPHLGSPIRIQKARFRPHPGQFRGDGECGQAGIGIEFLDISSEQSASLARFIKAHDELNPKLPPPNAPWLKENTPAPA